MDILLILLGVAVAHLLAVMSPGPSFLVVARTAAASSRTAGLWVAFGLGLGSVIWALAALFGLTLLFAAAPWLYSGLKIGGALYLIFLAVTLWRHAPKPLPIRADGGAERLTIHAALRLGLLTQIANPKVVVFFGSIFVALLPPHAGIGLMLALLPIVFLNEFLWFSLVAVAFSMPRLRTGYARLKTWIDRTTGAFLGALGLRLASDIP